MSITVRFFAALRERVGAPQVLVEAGELDGATVSSVFEHVTRNHPAAAAMRDHLRVAKNREFVGWDDPVGAGDEVAFIPPVSGGADDAASADGRFLMTKRPLAPAQVADMVRRPEAGAVVTFEGVVRDHTGARTVTRLEYEAYVEMALEKLVQVADEATSRWETIHVATHHRHGVLEIGEVAVVIAVSSPHRADAFAACQYVIDRLKEVVPIWKKEIGPDGAEWIGRGP